MSASTCMTFVWHCVVIFLASVVRRVDGIAAAAGAEKPLGIRFFDIRSGNQIVEVVLQNALRAEESAAARRGRAHGRIMRRPVATATARGCTSSSTLSSHT